MSLLLLFTAAVEEPAPAPSGGHPGRRGRTFTPQITQAEQPKPRRKRDEFWWWE